MAVPLRDAEPLYVGAASARPRRVGRTGLAGNGAGRHWGARVCGGVPQTDAGVLGQAAQSRQPVRVRFGRVHPPVHGLEGDLLLHEPRVKPIVHRNHHVSPAQRDAGARQRQLLVRASELHAHDQRKVHADAVQDGGVRPDGGPVR